MENNQVDDTFRANNFCKNLMKQVPEIREMFEQVTKTMDELMVLNKDILEDLGRRLIRACLRNAPVLSEDPEKLFRDPNIVFHHAVNEASRFVSELAKKRHEENKKAILASIDEYWKLMQELGDIEEEERREAERTEEEGA